MTSTSGETEVQSFTVYDKTGSMGIGMYNTTRSSTTNTNRQRVNNRNIAESGYWYDLRANLRDDGYGWVSTANGSNVTDGSTTWASNSTTDTVIPTKGWVNNPETSTNVVHRTGDETLAGTKTFSTIPVVGTADSDDNSTKAASTAFVASAITSAGTDFVHLAGAESISGAKTFTNNITVVNKDIYLQNSEGAKGSIRPNAIEFMPTTTNTNGGYIDFHYAGDTSDYTSRIIEDASGQLSYGGTGAKAESNSTSSNRIATVGWANDPTKSTNVVHRSDAETIAGVKTFTSIPIIKTQQPNLWIQTSNGEKGTAPSSTQYYWFGTIFDKNGTDQSNKLSQAYYTNFSSGNCSFTIDLFKPESESTIVAQSIGMYYDTAGTFSVASLKSGTNITNRNISFITNSTTSEYIATMGWVNNATTATNVVHRDSEETISGDKAFTGLIKGSAETGNNKTNHAIDLGHSNKNYVDFYEYGGEWNFYKSRGTTQTLIAKLTENYLQIPTPTEDTTNSVQADTVGARNTKLASYQLKATYDSTNEMMVLA